MVSLDLKDFDREGKLLIQGERNKQRTAYINNGALDALTDWLDVRGSAADPVFVAINKGGTVGSERPSTQAVYDTLAMPM
jgi:site-specific recombinase XerC